MANVVYILTNQCMPNLIKIGRTNDLNQRVRELSRATGVPLPFEVHYACEVEDNCKVEKALHEAFGEERINPKKEFFTKNPERVKAVLRLLSINEITLDSHLIAEDKPELDALTKLQNKRRANFKFSMASIPIGSEVSFINDEDKKARIIDDKRIEFEGQVTSLSALAQKLLGFNHPLQGTLYWIYENETLDERRQRIETESDE